MKGKKIMFGLFLGSLAAMNATTATTHAATRPENPSRCPGTEERQQGDPLRQARTAG